MSGRDNGAESLTGFGRILLPLFAPGTSRGIPLLSLNNLLSAKKSRVRFVSSNYLYTLKTSPSPTVTVTPACFAVHRDTKS